MRPGDYWGIFWAVVITLVVVLVIATREAVGCSSSNLRIDWTAEQPNPKIVRPSYHTSGWLLYCPALGKRVAVTIKERIRIGMRCTWAASITGPEL